MEVQGRLICLDDCLAFFTHSSYVHEETSKIIELLNKEMQTNADYSLPWRLASISDIKEHYDTIKEAIHDHNQADVWVTDRVQLSQASEPIHAIPKFYNVRTDVPANGSLIKARDDLHHALFFSDQPPNRKIFSGKQFVPAELGAPI